MKPPSGNSARSLQQQFQATLLLRGGVLLAALFAYAWFSVATQRDALRASVTAQGEQLKLALDDTIDVVRAHASTMRRSVEHSLARPELADAALTKRLREDQRGAPDAPVWTGLPRALRPDMGTLYVSPAAKIEPKAFERDLAAATTFLSVAAANHQWSKVFQWSYFYDGGERWFLIYPLLPRDEFFRAAQTQDLATAVKTIFDADGTRPVALVGPRNNPKREMVWTPAYQDASGKGMMVSLLAPIYLTDEYVGAVGTDVTLDTLDHALLDHGPDLGRAMVVDASGVVLADTGKALQGAKGKVRFSDLFPNLSADAALNSDKAWLQFPLANTPWKLVVHLDDSTMRARVVHALLPYLGMAVVLVIALFGMAYVQGRRYSGPALRLAEYIEQLDARPDTPLPDVPAAWNPLFARVADAARERQELLARAREHARELERKVAERTADLSATVASLQQTQKDLLRSDRLGTLGARVASVANELGVPLRKAEEGANRLGASLRDFQAALKIGLRKADVETFVAQVGQIGATVERNIDEAAALAQRFKQLAVDQVSEQPRRFKLREIAENVLAVMSPAMQRQGCAVSDQIGEDIDMSTYAGTLGQVLTHLLDAAAARVGRRPTGGEIRLSAAWESGDRGEMIALSMADNGIPDEASADRSEEKSAAAGALDIARRLLVERLGGSMEIASSADGTQISMRIPRNAG